MADIRWYFDFISPFAYLQWPQVRELAARRTVGFRPILFAGVLDRIGQKGPAEIPAKRLFTYRHVLWRARQRGLPMRLPPAHPFNPLLALRLCIALDTRPEAIGAIFDWIWKHGRAADSVEALAPLAAELGVPDLAAAIAAPAVKARLKAHFDEAMAQQVFGVPTLAIGDELFWGDDAFDFALAVLDDPGLLQEPAMRAITTLPVAASRL